MASVDVGAKQGSKKSLNAELNLVPFIDLLSMCICFLLMTAVWIQVGSMQIKQSHGTGGVEVAKKDYEIDLKMLGKSKAHLSLKQGGRVIKQRTILGDETPLLLSNLDQNLGEFLVSNKKETIRIATAMVTPNEAVSYGDLVLIMDTLRKRDITNIGVVPVRN